MTGVQTCALPICGSVGLLSPQTNNFSFSLWLNGTVFKDVISYWGMGQDTGKDVDDITASSLDLYDVNGSITPTAGVVGSGSAFNGSDSRYSVSYSSGIELRNMSMYTGLTVAAWANRTSSSTRAVARLHGASTKHSLWFDSSPSHYKFTLSSYIAESTHSAPLSTWEYLVGRWDGSNASISINASGATSVSAPSIGSDDSIANFDVGYDSNYFSGKIDEVGVWGRALTDTEVSYLYNGGIGKSLGSLSTTIMELPGSYKLYTSGDRVIFNITNGSFSASVTGVAYLGRPGWKHIACNVNHDSNTLELYINGQKTSVSNTLGRVGNHTSDFELANNGVLSLQLDEISYWYGRTLGYDDVLGLYNFGDGHDLEWILEN